MEQKTTYRVIKTDISPNDAVIFESQNFTVALSSDNLDLTVRYCIKTIIKRL